MCWCSRLETITILTNKKKQFWLFAYWRPFQARPFNSRYHSAVMSGGILEVPLLWRGTPACPTAVVVFSSLANIEYYHLLCGYFMMIIVMVLQNRSVIHYKILASSLIFNWIAKMLFNLIGILSVEIVNYLDFDVSLCTNNFFIYFQLYFYPMLLWFSSSRCDSNPEWFPWVTDWRFWIFFRIFIIGRKIPKSSDRDSGHRP